MGRRRGGVTRLKRFPVSFPWLVRTEARDATLVVFADYHAAEAVVAEHPLGDQDGS